MSMHRRILKLSVLGWAVACIAPHANAADAFPVRPVTIIVPFAAGGPVDIVARAIGKPLAALLKQPVLVENVGGASGVIGTAKVAKAAPDGYTLLLGTAGTNALNSAVYKDLPYRSPEDFTAIAELASIPSILSVGPASPFTSVSQLVEYIRKNPSRLTVGNAGPGSVSNLAALTFLDSIQGSVTTVPYKGTAPAFVDLMGGHIDALFDTSVQALPHVTGSKARALATTSASRLKSLPNVPTLQETCCAGLNLQIWYGLLAPKGLPANVLDALTTATLQARADPQFIAIMERSDANVARTGSGPEEFTTKIRTDTARFKRLAQSEQKVTPQ